MRFVPRSRVWRWRVGVMAVVGVSASALVASRAPAANSPAPVGTPSINSGPAAGAVTSSTSATFTFSGPATGLLYKCSLDGSEFKRCTSPQTYSNLGSQEHMFRVAAQFNGTGDLGRAAERKWTVDRTPPSVAVTFPGEDARLTATQWAAGCSPTTSEVCGTATDAAGVGSVSLALQSKATSRYWNGASFSSSSPVTLPAAGTTNWSYALPRPPDGTYVLQTTAADTLGNASSPSTASSRKFLIDTTAPPAPTILIRPEDATVSTTISFSFNKPADPTPKGDDDDVHEVKTLCSLDAAGIAPCSSPKTYTGLALGKHCFSVYAQDTLGNRSSASQYCWFVVTDKGFKISGDVAEPIDPGVPSPVNVKFENPFPFDLKVLTLTATVTSNKPSCVSSNFRAIQIPASVLTGMSPLPNGGSSLSALNVAQTDWLKVVLDVSPTVDQTACLGATFKISYKGTATKASNP